MSSTIYFTNPFYSYCVISPPGGQTGYGTGGPGHPGGQPVTGNARMYNYQSQPTTFSFFVFILDMPPAGQQMYGPAQQNGPQIPSNVRRPISQLIDACLKIFSDSMCTGKKKALTVRCSTDPVCTVADIFYRSVSTTSVRMESYEDVSTIRTTSRSFCAVRMAHYAQQPHPNHPI